MNPDSPAASATSSRLLFLGVAFGFVAASGIVISVAYFDPEWLVWVARFKAIVGGALALMVAMVFFAPHLSRTAAKDVSEQVHDTTERSARIASGLRERMGEHPFFAGALGAYPLAALISEQLVSATPQLQSPEITPLWTLAGVALCAVVLVFIDAGRTQRAVAGLFLVAMAFGAAAAVFGTRSQPHWVYGSGAVALVLLLTAWWLRRPSRT